MSAYAQLLPIMTLLCVLTEQKVPSLEKSLPAEARRD
jgi:hypothetical protein